MRELISVTAVQPFPFHGRSVQVGERLSVSPVEALSLTYRKLAKFSQQMTRYRTAAVKSEPATEPDTPKTKRQYKRRDMQAED